MSACTLQFFHFLNHNDHTSKFPRLHLNSNKFLPFERVQIQKWRAYGFSKVPSAPHQREPQPFSSKVVRPMTYLPLRWNHTRLWVFNRRRQILDFFIVLKKLLDLTEDNGVGRGSECFCIKSYSFGSCNVRIVFSKITYTD